VLSPDGISSSAYGPEEVLIALLPLAGLAAFTLILPMTLVILLVMTLVVASYREIVMVYIRAGGSYVVARQNFGPRIAQAVLACELSDGTGDLTALFYGRSHIPGLVCGARVRLTGPVGFRPGSAPVMANPAYELLFPDGS
jgi:amino acid transporter